MAIVKILEVASIFLFFVFMATQVIWPLFKDRPLFPAFNRKAAKLEAELTGIKGAQDERALEAGVANARKNLGRNLKRLGN